jgi:hypothetical protein
METLMAFAFGVAAGALAIYIPWMSYAFKRYVLPCSSAHCPHHRDDNIRRIREANDRERNGPTRPDIR